MNFLQIQIFAAQGHWQQGDGDAGQDQESGEGWRGERNKFDVTVGNEWVRSLVRDFWETWEDISSCGKSTGKQELKLSINSWLIVLRHIIKILQFICIFRKYKD